MNGLQKFEFNSNPISVIEDEKGVWFVAKDISDILGYRSANDATRILDEDEKMIRTLCVSGQNRNVGLINESGLYSMVLRSNKPEAKAFKKWVTSEVLPTIRKHGAYLTVEKTEELINNPDLIIQLATNLKEERNKRELAEQRVEFQERVLIESAPKVEYYETVLSSNDAIITNLIAKELGMSAVTLNKTLNKKGVIYKQSDSWVLYRKYQDKGFAKTKTYTYTGSDASQHTSIQLVWTQKGREFIHNLIKGAN